MSPVSDAFKPMLTAMILAGALLLWLIPKAIDWFDKVTGRVIDRDELRHKFRHAMDELDDIHQLLRVAKALQRIQPWAKARGVILVPYCCRVDGRVVKRGLGILETDLNTSGDA